ncbi:MAG: HPF/RaiA family ribosome-associated protein, partial [Bdellovibrionales bacterium]|nr:HPF/RaiA family ribosome-associated protein [Bdellovibrionales bacterium]
SMEPILAKHFPEDETIHVTLSKTSPTSFKVGMQGHMKGENIVSHHESHNFHKALELCKDHFIKQVEKKKDIQKHNRR